jgi:alpha-tubulin suppressor-like RCC1 family protein
MSDAASFKEGLMCRANLVFGLGLTSLLAFTGCGGDPARPATVDSVSISPSSVSHDALGATADLIATARSSDGSVIAGQEFSWSSSNESVATVFSLPSLPEAGSVVTAVGNGTATITASAGGASGTASVTVQQVASDVSVAPATAVLTFAGETVQLTAEATDRNGHAIAAGVDWTTSDETVATVNDAGLVEAKANGVAEITASAGSESALSTVTVAIPAPAVLMVTAGFYHSCALTEGGVAYCWGRNNNGQLGDASTTNSLVPVAVQGGLSFDSISAGTNHTCGVTTTGLGYCWGLGDKGQVGDGGLGQRVAPAAVVGGHVFRSIEGGRGHTCGLTVGGAVFCWGGGGNGELGNGATANEVVPDSVWGDSRYTTVKGWAHTVCAVTTTGESHCWGRNNTGQVGDGTTALRSVPTAVATAAAFVSVSSGARIVNGFGGGTSCGVTALGEGYCWGQNSNGQIGDASQTGRLIPVEVFGGITWKAIDVGSSTTCGVATDGTGYCWGYNGNGVVGDGTSIGRLVPTEISGGLSFSQISVEFDHACGVTTDGDAYCWGSNAYGELGNGTTTSSTVPVMVSIPE